jgi:hypothetical protein
MAIFYTDSGSILNLQVSRSLVASGSTTISGSLYLNGTQNIPDPPSGVEFLAYNTSSGEVVKAPGYIENINDLKTVVFDVNQLVDGTVFWTGDGMNYSASAHTYYIQGTRYTAPPGLITLTAANPTFPRIDVIYADVNGSYGHLTGTPDANPIKPIVDYETQIELTLVSVGAGAAQPTINITDIYLENTEWSSSIVTPGTNTTIDFDSTVSPYAGSKCVRVTRTGTGGIQGASFQFKLTSSLQDFSGKLLTLALSSSAAWSGSNRITFELFNESTRISNTPVVFSGTSYGYNSSNPNWQIVAIPTSDFDLGVQGSSGNILRATFNNVAWPTSSGFNVGFDNIQLQTDTETGNNIQFITTASAAGNVITFTKRNGSTFTVSVGGIQTIFRIANTVQSVL